MITTFYWRAVGTEDLLRAILRKFFSAEGAGEIQLNCNIPNGLVTLSVPDKIAKWVHAQCTRRGIHALTLTGPDLARAIVGLTAQLRQRADDDGLSDVVRLDEHDDDETV